MMASGWALYGGVAALTRGHLDEAEQSLLEATAGFVANDSFRMAHCCLSAHAATLALKGDQQAGAMMDRAEGLDHPAYRVLAPFVESWRAWIAYAAGDLATAIAAAKRCAGLARESGMPVLEALALYDLARLGAKPDLARLDALDNDLVRVVAAAARAKTLLLQPAELTGVLTAREREVVLLAAEHTSAEIAQKLSLALPTVNNNLARAYTKLGITGRAQLRTLLGDSQPD